MENSRTMAGPNQSHLPPSTLAPVQSSSTVARDEIGQRQVLFLGAGVEMQCGVGHFTQGLSDAMERLYPGTRTEFTLTRQTGTLAALWRAVGAVDTIICNFPIVSWKRVILRPLVALAMARLRGRKVVVVEHEWNSLHWARRLTYVPALLLANTIVMFSPLVKRQLAAEPMLGWLSRRCVLAPLPPNVAAPLMVADSPLRQRLVAAKREGRLIVGHFGSIYPGKQPEAVLAVGAVLKERGFNPLVVYIGSFIRGVERVEEAFYEKARAIGIADDLIVSGFVDSEPELFGLFTQVDAFCYQLDEGLTARRASIIACTQSGKRIVVTAPEDENEFAHHPRFQELIRNGSIILIARDLDAAAYADAIVAAVSKRSDLPSFDFNGWWSDVTKAIHDHV